MVVTVKVAEFAPAETVTEDGTVASELLDDRLTAAPPLGALPVRVTVPVNCVPPTIVEGASVTDEGIGGVTVSV